MLIVDPSCKDHLILASEFAEKRGLYAQLKAKLDYLANYADSQTRCLLFRDFAPHSFEFVIQSKKTNPDGTEKWERWMNGGLIYEGPDQPADGSAPSFTVSIGNREPGWYVHT